MTGPFEGALGHVHDRNDEEKTVTIQLDLGMQQFQEITVKQEIVVVGGEVTDPYELCLMEEEETNVLTVSELTTPFIKEPNNVGKDDDDHDDHDAKKQGSKPAAIPKRHKKKKAKRAKRDNSVASKPQGKSTGDQWKDHPVARYAQKYPKFKACVSDLCHWIIGYNLDQTLQAIFAYIKLELRKKMIESSSTDPGH